MLDKVFSKIFGDPIPPELCGQFKDTFCYLSIKDRHPVTLTKVIDQIYKAGANNPELSDDSKLVTSTLSRLKNRLQTDKAVEVFTSDDNVVKIWNERLDSLNPNTWFSAPWLVVECYLYRVIHETLQNTVHFKYPHFDIFRDEKCEGLQKSFQSMAEIGEVLQSISDASSLNLETFIKFSLWGNKTDLSLLKHFNLELADVQHANASKNDDKILTDHLPRILEFLASISNGQVDIVLDNAGYELFSDLCLAEVLLQAKMAKCVKFHMKTIPWFVSDVTAYDMDFMMKSLSGSSHKALRELGSRWTERLKDGTFISTQNDFWTTPYGFKDMPRLAPDLYQELSAADIVFFKGDLNYRKLVNDRKWAYDTEFSVALEGFNPTKVVALRTIKCDSLAGCCDASRVKEIMRSDWDSMFNGTYAAVSCNF